jgi:hypothetical protein
LEDVIQLFAKIPSNLFTTSVLYINHSDMLVGCYNEKETFLFCSAKASWWEFDLDESLDYFEIAIDTQTIQNKLNKMDKIYNCISFYMYNDKEEGKKYIDCVLTNRSTGVQGSFKIVEETVVSKSKTEWDNDINLYHGTIARYYERKYNIDSEMIWKTIDGVWKKCSLLHFPFVYQDRITISMSGQGKRKRDVDDQKNFNYHIPLYGFSQVGVTNPRIKPMEIDISLGWDVTKLGKYFSLNRTGQCTIYFYEKNLIAFHQARIGISLFMLKNTPTCET